MISGKVFYGGANSIMVNKEEENTHKQCSCDSCIECNCDPKVCRCSCHTNEEN